MITGHDDARALGVYLDVAERATARRDRIERGQFTCPAIDRNAFTPPPPNSPAPTSVNPFAKNLYENITRLKLDVEHIAPLHGRLVKVDELRSFITVASK